MRARWATLLQLAAAAMGRGREEKDQRARGGQRVGEQEQPPPSLQWNSIRSSMFTMASSLS